MILVERNRPTKKEEEETWIEGKGEEDKARRGRKGDQSGRGRCEKKTGRSRGGGEEKKKEIKEKGRETQGQRAWGWMEKEREKK